jgi:creatinine amidohydrolase
MLWHEQSWPTIRALDKNLPVVIPLGSVEQHGHHLPLCVDSVQVTAVAERVEQALGDAALFLPTLWLGCSEHHRDFPGTISVPPSLYSEMIKAVVKSILHAGFTRIFFLNGHGGNETPAAQALTEIVGEDDAADSAHIAFTSWWQVARESVTPARHGMSSPAITHACEYETSLMLALRPDLVHLAAARDELPALMTPWYHSELGGRARLFHRFHRLTTAGSMGNPSQATRDKGISLLDAVAAEVIAFVRDFATWPLLPPRR